MKIIFGNNGAEKTFFKEGRQKEGALVLSSNLYDWSLQDISKSKLNTFKISENIRFLSKNKDEIESKVSLIELPEGINRASWKK